ncbi:MULTISPECIES: formate dehydrogenase accessory sulfurtransferase FdhD [unclassified Lysobacter]|uniref:formate dehydrogenase accessory sulfurtransferase FdhD n=1 Tax=unclassified Lysobacter TaxID=2635362 RepID=UPI001BEB567E|nr:MULTISPECIES: formate dehydrogenase accessory sulfurtransferase FdhD [unclassified Lysobacter]MBT2747031.1 formate dehydrogenase accessory sulfurtransferase FdhD [Lysobacter sp. ISL-42]MBT2750508.1 formate dehydrogenase accessory sulfurtransferase FdhD [Lysobacter sp. ISL-50]MBT2776354.1 formate dehydrogenase accessory sulfurtransferase FdhD [Lysobacter sp. ISL-54]MBT2780849.1 formate dehydrogenase accessory sulfurtransferase FdhD [Lysobacter sp. ISL-52]
MSTQRPLPGSERDAEPEADRAGAVRRTVRRRRGANVREALDVIAAEVPVALIYNDTPFAVMMATPEDLADFALGFSLSEGIVAGAGELRVEEIATSLEGISLRLSVPGERAAALEQRRRNLQGRSGCGVCGTESIEAVLRPPPRVGDSAPVRARALQRALRELRQRQPLNALTGATHAAGWADVHGRVLLVREDVGRHNALDKLIGAMSAAGIDPLRGFAVVTSRASYEMAMKTAQAGIALLAAISAPTALAIALAQAAHLTLIGFARDDGHAVYTHAQRLLEGDGLEDAAQLSRERDAERDATESDS